VYEPAGRRAGAHAPASAAHGEWTRATTRGSTINRAMALPPGGIPMRAYCTRLSPPSFGRSRAACRLGATVAGDVERDRGRRELVERVLAVLREHRERATALAARKPQRDEESLV
jgi:hypothetical protein